MFELKWGFGVLGSNTQRVRLPLLLRRRSPANSPATSQLACLGLSSLSLSLTRSASRDAEGATTSAGVVRLLASSALAGGSRLPLDASEAAPTSRGLVAALVQAPLLVLWVGTVCWRESRVSRTEVRPRNT